MQNIEHFLSKKTNDGSCYVVDLSSAADNDLLIISDSLGLALNIDEMKRIKHYFEKKNRNPTDIELQALGQAWSEHCCYKSSKVPLQKYVFGIEEDRIVAREDAGVLEFDGNHYYCAALESHNHPSAVEPYGGAATGVGGIVRDIVCMGAQPIAYIDPLFFGPLDLPQKMVPPGTKHPRFLCKGVVDGIRDYGNRIGVPTLSGQLCFHEGYTGNCLVNVGCIGIMKKSELIHSRAKAPGDIYVYVGGKTGRDGIHGVTFASAELTDESEKSSRSAVQVGDPITKEPLIHVTLECNRKGLLEGLKDFGGGGLSCVCGELAYDAGFGAEIHLDAIPLKEEGLLPWEIWVSESQERMMFLVSKKNLDQVLHICQQWDVTAAVVGKVIPDKITRVFYKKKKILELDMDFFTGGPVYDSCQRPYVEWNNPDETDPKYNLSDGNDILLRLLKSFPIASKEWVIRQYDHEVRGRTVIKPLQGRINRESHGDATVIKPLEESNRGLAVTANINPRFMERNPYWGAISAIDETCRNLVCVGAKPNALLDCLNFGNPEKPEEMGEFYEACRGLGDAARRLKLPFMSGNVSFYNESKFSSVPPTPQITGIGIVEDVRTCVTSDFKKENNSIYLIGADTKCELGGSAVHHTLNLEGGKVPRCDLDLLEKCMDTILLCMKKGFIAACHDCSEGGLGVCLAEMCIGGGMGCRIDIGPIGGDLRSDHKLFSETNSRWVVEIKRECEKVFTSLLKKQEIPCYHLGVTEGEQLVISDHKKRIINQTIAHLDKTWRRAIEEAMGG